MSQHPIPEYYTPSPPKGSGLAIAAMVLGIVALVLSCFWFVSIPCAILAVVFGVIGKSRADRGEASGRGMAIAGITCGIVALVIDLLIIAMIIVGFDLLNQEMRKQQLQQGAMIMQETSAVETPVAA
jgi:hypothetical protein